MCVCSAFDLENKVVGTVGCGRIGQRVLRRLQVCTVNAVDVQNWDVQTVNAHKRQIAWLHCRCKMLLLLAAAANTSVGLSRHCCHQLLAEA